YVFQRIGRAGQVSVRIVDIGRLGTNGVARVRIGLRDGDGQPWTIRVAERVILGSNFARRFFHTDNAIQGIVSMVGRRPSGRSVLGLRLADARLPIDIIVAVGGHRAAGIGCLIYLARRGVREI